MGKRSDFERRDRDFYPTPVEPVLKLKPWLRPGDRFAEPCVGEGDLRRHLTEHLGMVCVWASDLPLDARNLPALATVDADYIVTNPPWPAIGQRGEPTVEIIRTCMAFRMSWFLLSADFAHNAYFRPIEKHCRRIVSVGRVQWIPDSSMTGKDNCAWYLFSERHTEGPRFHNMEG